MAPPNPSRDDLRSVADWLAGVRPRLAAELRTAGRVLIRDLPLRTGADLARVRELLGVRVARTTEAFGHRRVLGPDVLSDLRWPADRDRCPFPEQCFSTHFPDLVILACLAAPRSGGQLLVADNREVPRHLPADLVDRFRAVGWRLSRTFHPSFGISWQEGFDVADAAELEVALDDQQIDWEWLPDGVLRTRRRRAAIVRHPATGDDCWFNAAGFLNEWSLVPAERQLMIAAFGAGQLPVNTAFGDGAALSEQDTATIQDAYDLAAERVALAPGDVMLVDNVLTSCGRCAYQGDLALAVALCDGVAGLAARTDVSTLDGRA